MRTRGEGGSDHDQNTHFVRIYLVLCVVYFSVNYYYEYAIYIIEIGKLEK